MVRLINPEDWLLVLAVLASLASLPLALLIVLRIFHIPAGTLFCRKAFLVAGQILGIILMILLLVQVGIDSDGLGAKLIYGRF